MFVIRGAYIRCGLYSGGLYLGFYGMFKNHQFLNYLRTDTLYCKHHRLQYFVAMKGKGLDMKV